MRSTSFLVAVTLFALATTASPLFGQEGKAKPTVWMGPPSYDNGKCFRELFEHPGAWKEARSVIDVLMYADHQLDRQFTDDELRAWFLQLQQWKLKFALEVGAVKPWGQTGEKTFAVQRPKWERFRSLGANLHAIAMDEPLLCCRKHIDKPDDYALVRGRPDQYVIESWIKAPSKSTPESEPWTFTRSVLDFTRKFVKQSP